MSLKEAMMWVESLGIKECVFETDSKLPVDVCNENHGKLDFHLIVSNCVESFKHFDNVYIQFVYKFANVIAHMIVRVSQYMQF